MNKGLSGLFAGKTDENEHAGEPGESEDVSGGLFDSANFGWKCNCFLRCNLRISSRILAAIISKIQQISYKYQKIHNLQYLLSVTLSVP